jgi:hypothetical protein
MSVDITYYNIMLREIIVKGALTGAVQLHG